MKLQISGWLRDLRLGVRLLSEKPRFTALVTLTLAVAIGASTIIFSFVNVLVLEPPPLQNPDRVVFVYTGGVASTNQGRVERARKASLLFGDLLHRLIGAPSRPCSRP